MKKCSGFFLCVLVLGLFWGASHGVAQEQNGAAAEAAPPAPLFENLGSYQHSITTTSELAQRYFNQGLRLTYAFNHAEAIRAFTEVTQIDPNCAMAYWGLALALGPNINAPMETAQGRQAYAAIQQAIALARYAGEPERAYIEALATRYAADPETADRGALDTAYAEAMRQLSERYADDPDARTLFAAALMNVRPWDYWTPDSQPKAGTLALVAALESVLERFPNHIGAIHYYIHAIEASSQPERALPHARRLSALIPGSGHLVHMPSHIYLRVGLYNDAAISNVEAVEADEGYIKAEAPQGLYRMMYYPHNVDFLWAVQQMQGRSAEAIKTAGKLAELTPPDVARQFPLLEAWTAMPLCALVRFGKWQEILNAPQPPKDLDYMTGMWHYARALAFAATEQVEDAKKEQAALETIVTGVDPEREMMGRNTASDLLGIAAQIVAGELAAQQDKTTEAVQHLKKAVAIQDQLQYSEPPPWYYPVRQSLGAVLLTAGKAAEAQAVYQEDLKQNPKNGWSLYGLAQSLHAQGATAKAKLVEEEFQKTWTRADVTLSASRF
jgi:tetratricopeptide (TPR) repeat protein